MFLIHLLVVPFCIKWRLFNIRIYLSYFGFYMEYVVTEGKQWSAKTGCIIFFGIFFLIFFVYIVDYYLKGTLFLTPVPHRFFRSSPYVPLPVKSCKIKIFFSKKYNYISVTLSCLAPNSDMWIYTENLCRSNIFLCTFFKCFWCYTRFLSVPVFCLLLTACILVVILHICAVYGHLSFFYWKVTFPFTCSLTQLLA